MNKSSSGKTEVSILWSQFPCSASEREKFYLVRRRDWYRYNFNKYNCALEHFRLFHCYRFFIQDSWRLWSFGLLQVPRRSSQIQSRIVKTHVRTHVGLHEIHCIELCSRWRALNQMRHYHGEARYEQNGHNERAISQGSSTISTLKVRLGSERLIC